MKKLILLKIAVTLLFTKPTFASLEDGPENKGPVKGALEFRSEQVYPIMELPDEIIVHILKKVAYPSLLHLRATNKFFNNSICSIVPPASIKVSYGPFSKSKCFTQATLKLFKSCKVVNERFFNAIHLDLRSNHHSEVEDVDIMQHTPGVHKLAITTNHPLEMLNPNTKQHLKSLRITFKLLSNYCTQPSAKSFQGLLNLADLELNYVTIEFDPLPLLPNLVKLVLYGTKWTTPLSQANSTVRGLKVGDSVIPTLFFSQLTCLTRLILWCQPLSDNDLKGCTSLHYFKSTFNTPDLTDEAFKGLINLETLILKNNNKLTQKCLTYLPKLKVKKISDCKNLDDQFS